LILTKIIKIVANRCQILRLKRWGSLERSPDLLTGFKGREERGRGKEKGSGGRGKRSPCSDFTI